MSRREVAKINKDAAVAMALDVITGDSVSAHAHEVDVANLLGARTCS